jgi:hypothetical protein
MTYTKTSSIVKRLLSEATSESIQDALSSVPGL